MPHSRSFPAMVTIAMLGLSSLALAQQPDTTVDVTVRVPGTIPGLQVRLFVNGSLARFRFPGSGEVTLPFVMERSGTVRLEFHLVDKPAVTMVDRWAAQATLNGSGHVIWEIQGIGASSVQQWAALRLGSTGNPLDVLVAGRRAGRTPLTTGVAPGGPWEILWRHPDGTTACVTSLETGPDQTHGLTCDPSTGSVQTTPPGNQPGEAVVFPSIRSRNR